MGERRLRASSPWMAIGLAVCAGLALCMGGCASADKGSEEKGSEFPETGGNGANSFDDLNDASPQSADESAKGNAGNQGAEEADEFGLGNNELQGEATPAGKDQLPEEELALNGNGNPGGNRQGAGNLPSDANLTGPANPAAGSPGNPALPTPANAGVEAPAFSVSEAPQAVAPPPEPVITGGQDLTGLAADAQMDLPPSSSGTGSPDSLVPPEAAASAEPVVPTSGSADSAPNLNAQSVSSLPRSGTRELSSEELKEAQEAIAKLTDLLPGTGPESYVVQPGDTLWDICDQLVDDPYWWPKLWSLNPDLRNPNLIHPGARLVFSPSDGAAAPVLAVKEEIPSVMPVDSELLSRVLVSANPLAQQWQGQDGNLIAGSDLPADPSVENIGGYTAAASYMIRLPGMLSATPESLGEIVRTAASPVGAGEGEEAYARFEREGKPGQRYLAVRKIEEAYRDPSGEDLDARVWIFTGIVGVSRANASGISTLTVESSTHGVAEGDLLIPYRNIFRAIDPASTGRSSSVQARVVAVLDTVTSMASQGQAVYLRTDDGKGINPGDSFDLFMPPGGNVGFEREGLDGVLVAQVQVVDVTEDGAVAIITRSRREVTVGAQTWPAF